MKEIDKIQKLILETSSLFWENLISPMGQILSPLYNDHTFDAFVGSLAGAVGGYLMVIFTNNRSEVRSKVGNLKSAMAVVYSLFNVFAGLKKQHISNMCEEFENGRRKFLSVKSENVKIEGEFEILFDYRTISFPYVDFSLINSRVFERPDLNGRAFALATMLVQILYGLKEQLASREIILNEINHLSNKANLNAHDKACLYYGVPFNHPALGDLVYEKYANIMKACYQYTDDAIWFSKELSLELGLQGKKTARQLFFSRPKIGSVDYSDVSPGIIPNDSYYKDWREKFKRT